MADSSSSQILGGVLISPGVQSLPPERSAFNSLIAATNDPLDAVVSIERSPISVRKFLKSPPMARARSVTLDASDTVLPYALAML